MPPRAAPEKIQIDVMRSFLGRARGLGASHAGTHHWKAERLSAVALVPLTLWFVWAVVAHAGAPYAAVHAWAGRPVNATLLLALVAATFHHTALGVEVILGDYVNTKWQEKLSVLAVKGLCAFLAILSAVAILRLAFA